MKACLVVEPGKIVLVIPLDIRQVTWISYIVLQKLKYSSAGRSQKSWFLCPETKVI
jgi:hypothetical protein